MLNYNVTKEDIDKNAGLIKKSVKFPELCSCRALIYDIDSPSKAKEEARQYNTKLSIMNGLDVKIAVLHFYDEKDKLQTVIDYSNPNEIKLPLGDTGFKTSLYFRLSPKWLQYQKFATPKDDIEAAVLFNVWLEKTLGIPADLNKDMLNGGIAFSTWRSWYIKTDTDDKGNEKKQYQSNFSCYNSKLKARLTGAEIDYEIIDPTLTASIITAITPPDDTPF